MSSLGNKADHNFGAAPLATLTKFGSVVDDDDDELDTPTSFGNQAFGSAPNEAGSQFMTSKSDTDPAPRSIIPGAVASPNVGLFYWIEDPLFAVTIMNNVV